MGPEQPTFEISDVVTTTMGRDRGEWFYVVGVDAQYVYLANGRNRTLESPKRKKPRHIEKVLRSETRVAGKLRSGDKVLNGELRRDLASLSRGMQANDLGG